MAEGGSAEVVQQQVADNTGGSVEPPTSTTVDPPENENTPCLGLNTPDNQIARIGMKLVDNAIWTANNKEQCIIYTDTLTNDIPDFVLKDDDGKEYSVKGAPKGTAILWYTRVAVGSFDHGSALPIFGGETGGLAVFQNAFAPRVDHDGDKNRITLTYWTNVDGDLAKIGVRQGGFLCTVPEVAQPKIAAEDQDNTSPPTVQTPSAKSKQMNRSLMATDGYSTKIVSKDGKELPYSVVYIFDTPKQLMEKKGGINEYDLSLSAASGVICDTDRDDGSSNSTIIYAGDCVNHGDFDDLTVVAPFVGGGSGGAAGTPPARSVELSDGRVTKIPDEATGSVPAQEGSTTGGSVASWMLWLNQNLNYQGVGTARGGMVYQTAQAGSSFAKRQKVDPTTGKIKPDQTGKKCGA